MIWLMNREKRAHLFAALGDPVRLAIVEDLMVSDAAPRDLSRRHELPSNLLAHHLSVLEDADVITRSISDGDRRRRYLSLRYETLHGLNLQPAVPNGPVLFVCTRNSARSQLAAAVWNSLADSPASSAGTEPASAIHPGTIDAAARAGLDLSGAKTQHLAEVSVEPALVITVCDQAHEQVEGDLAHWHWSTPDPVVRATTRSFDNALNKLRDRIVAVTGAEQ